MNGQPRQPPHHRGTAGPTARASGDGRAPVLAITGLTAGYDDVPVVRNLDLVVGRGEVVALLGANGAGKTTTLRAVSGLAEQLSGTITFHGTDLAGVGPSTRARRGIAHVPDDRGVFFGLTVAEHLRLGPRTERLASEAVYARFPALHPLRERKAGLLSGGEQQMLAVGRALARRPSLLLLDELSLGLAPVIVEDLLPVIRTFADETDSGVLLVEQHIGLALEIADRGYVLSHGEVTLHRPAAELAADRELVLAGYLGNHAGAEPDAG